MLDPRLPVHGLRRAGAPVSDWQRRIVSRADTLAGHWRVRGTRIPVYLVLEFLAAGETTESLLANYPTLTLDDVRACLRFGAALAQWGPPDRGGPRAIGFVVDPPPDIAAAFANDEDEDATP